MTKYLKFEDTPVWQKSREFITVIYTELASNKKLARDYALCDQLKRAAYSIMLNIAEGFERGSNRENSHFIDFAKGSAAEVRSILYILHDNAFITDTKFDSLKKEVEDISLQLSNFKRYLAKNAYTKRF